MKRYMILSAAIVAFAGSSLSAAPMQGKPVQQKPVTTVWPGQSGCGAASNRENSAITSEGEC